MKTGLGQKVEQGTRTTADGTRGERTGFGRDGHKIYRRGNRESVRAFIRERLNWPLSKLVAALREAGYYKELDDKKLKSHVRRYQYHIRWEQEHTISPVDIATAFGEWVRSTRDEKHLTQEELAQKAGVTMRTVNLLEAGRLENLHRRTQNKIADALGEKPPKAAIESTEREARVTGLGALVDFDPYDDGEVTEVPQDSGIYIFYDRSQRPVYVGETSDLRRRLREHKRYDHWFRAPVVEAASYIVVPTEEARKQLEQVLIRVLRTTAILNKQHTDF